MKTFPHWRNVGRAMRWARQQEGVTVERHAWRSNGSSVVVTEVNGLIIDLPDYGYADTGHLDAGQVLRVLAALDLIPAHLAGVPAWQQIEGERYGQCLTCGRLARWWDDPLRPSWVHVQPWAVTNSHVPVVAHA